MTTFLLIRHGTSSVQDRISGRTPGIALSAQGEREIQQLARHLRDRPMTAVYTSPIDRTLQTAKAVADRLGLVPIANDALLELHFGDWTMQSFAALAADPRWLPFNTFRSGTRIPGGELMLETQARVVRWMLELRDLHPQDQLALVTHGDVIRAALSYFLGMPLDLYARLEISPASFSEVELGRDFVRVLGMNLRAPAS
jgi:broad specificity phosphatase PhoE